MDTAIFLFGLGTVIAAAGGLVLVSFSLRRPRASRRDSMRW